MRLRTFIPTSTPALLEKPSKNSGSGLTASTLVNGVWPLLQPVWRKRTNHQPSSAAKWWISTTGSNDNVILHWQCWRYDLLKKQVVSETVREFW